MSKPIAFILFALGFAPAAYGLDVARANALLSKACQNAVQLPYAPDFSAKLAALDREAEESPTAVGELLARFTARMARQYAERRTPASEAAIQQCVAAYPEVRLDILMLEEGPAASQVASGAGEAR